ncbi:MAG: right-handed parallel beta-helix repeat-containing protein [Acidobacteriota bacterium]|nr:right-handed parallel beta-helix repeat-containing protein [Acidobacteriota bacterium]
MKRISLGVALAVWGVAVVGMVQPAAAATLCVGAGGVNCYATIGAAVAQATAGDTIQVSQGIYHEDVVIGKPLSLIGKNAANTIIDATGMSNGIYIDGLDNSGLAHVIVSGFTVRNANFEGILMTNVSDSAVWGNELTGNDLSLDYAKQVCPGLPSFETSEAFDCGEGIHLSGVDHSLIGGNSIHGNSGGILISDETGPTHDNWIANNLVKSNVFDCGITIPSHPRAPSMPSGPPFGVYGNVISGNVSEYNGTMGGGAGVGLFGFLPGARVSGNTISGNTIIGNGLPGVAMHAHAPGANMNNNVITGNYIAGNGPDTEDAATPGPAGINLYINIHGASGPSGILVSKNVIKDEANDVVVKMPESMDVHWNNLNGGGNGVVNLGPATVDATNNWWGCSQGPGANGCSHVMGANVTVDPALSSPAVPNGSPTAQQ